MKIGKKDYNLYKVKKRISVEKVKFSRGYSYISTLGIPFLVAKQVGDMVNISWFFVFVPAIALIWLLGEIDYKKGLFENEAEIGLIKNPEWNKKMEQQKNNETFK
jgi:hypothetical protein